jgi:hypothetical protein
MPVSFVGATTLARASAATTITAAAPTGLASGDLLIACLATRDNSFVASGWTIIRRVPFKESSGAVNAYLTIYRKDTVTTGDSGASFTFEHLSPGGFMALSYLAFRGVASVSETNWAYSQVDVLYVPMSEVTSTLDGSAIVAAGAHTLAYDSATTVPPDLFTLTTGGPYNPNHMAAAYRLVNSGVTGSGLFYMAPPFEESVATAGSLNGIGAITLLLAPTVVGPHPGAEVGAYVACPGPLGAPSTLGVVSIDCRASAPSPLGAARAEVFHDFSAAVEGRPLVYVVDLETTGGRVRVPISSWQATLQTEQSNYLQVVIPACEPYLAAINAATRVRVFRRCVLRDGTAFEYQMATVPLQTVTTARGPNNYTATLSGYSAGSVLVSSPPSATARTLQDVRTIFTSPSGLRVRCAIDWLLRPAQIAFVGTSPFVVAFINYYVSDGDQYMDVGERVEPG